MGNHQHSLLTAKVLAPTFEEEKMDWWLKQSQIASINVIKEYMVEKMEIFEICGKVMNSRRSDNFSGGASFDLLKKFHLTTSWMIYHLHDSPQWD